MAMYREDIENTIPQTTNPDERRNSINRIREQHVILCRRAIQDGKTIVSIEHILIVNSFVVSFLTPSLSSLVNSLRTQHGSPYRRVLLYLIGDGSFSSVETPKRIRIQFPRRTISLFRITQNITNL